jgi:hypothetical protein
MEGSTLEQETDEERAERERLEQEAEALAAAANDPEAERRKAAVDAAANVEDPKDLTEQEAMDGAEWFMSDEEEDEGYLDFDLNVGQKSPKWVRFRVQALTRERIDQIRKQNQIIQPDGTIQNRELEANVRIAVEALISPNLSKPENRVVRGQTFMDPADALVARFAHKPGLVDQITGKAIDVSGYNEGDIREVRAGKR